MKKQINNTTKESLSLPKLRFTGFQENWEKEKLGDIGETLIGLTYSPNDVVVANKGILVLRSSNIKNGAIVLNDNVYVDANITEKNFVYENDILICARNGSRNLIGKNAIIKKEHAGHAFGAFMTIYRSNCNHFVLYHLQRDEFRFQVNQHLGATINQITSKSLNSFAFRFPSISEQTKIASFLSAVDEKLQALKEIKNLLEEYRKGVLQKIFSQELRFKNDDGEVFSNWQQKNLGDITFKVDKKNKKNEKLPIYSISNVNGFVPQSEQFEGMDSNERGYDISLYKIIKKNTFAYNPARINVGSIGYSGNLDNVIVSSLYVCFKTKESINDDFFNYFLKTKDFNNSVLKKGEGGVRIYLFYENFSQIPISFPSIPEQLKIAEFLCYLDERINQTKIQIENTEIWKKGLLQKMFV